MRIRTYLIIDDDITFQKIMHGIIRAADPNARVLYSEDRGEAYQLFQENKRDLALIAMDGCLNRDQRLDTVELTRQIRQDGWTGYMVGTSSMADYLPRQIEAGCDQAILKMNAVKAIYECIAQLARPIAA